MKKEKVTNAPIDNDCNVEANDQKQNDDTNANSGEKELLELQNKVNELQSKYDEANTKALNLEDALLRSKAEFVNYRKRLEEESAKNLKYCNEDLVKELLPIIDNFERAIKLDSPDLTDELSKFLAGFKMTYCNQVEILEKYGVKAIDGSNKVFDANYHQAVMTEHRDGVEPGMVLEVLQKGYLLKDKVIRHAMVKVSE